MQQVEILPKEKNKEKIDLLLEQLINDLSLLDIAALERFRELWLVYINDVEDMPQWVAEFCSKVVELVIQAKEDK